MSEVPLQSWVDCKSIPEGFVEVEVPGAMQCKAMAMTPKNAEQ